MKAISIRQPWASLIIAGIKDLENRTWATSHRGPILIHAAAKMTAHEYRDAFAFISQRLGETAARRIIPARFNLPMGGIIGSANITAVVTASKSKWFTGPVAWVMTDVQPVPFLPCKGALGIFLPSIAGPAEPVLL